MTSNVAGINAEYGATGYSVETRTDGSCIKFTSALAFQHMLTDPAVIADGRTVGQANREKLHEYLQNWIDKNLKPA